ncbi:MAG: hypothetical protein KIT09_13090 [Bryobacteraceae bacterium]|nr:hypothetical protein [Bryobacteraceae bacterium]
MKSYDKWMNRILGEYRSRVLDETVAAGVTVRDDEDNLALLKHYPPDLPPPGEEVFRSN